MARFAFGKIESVSIARGRLAFGKSSHTIGPCPMQLPAQRIDKALADRRRKEKALLDEARDSANFQTPEADQHGSYGVKVNREGKRRAYNSTCTNLDYYLKKRLISAAQHGAANSLYRDFYNAGLAGNFKSCLNVTIGGGGLNLAGFNLQGYESFRSALRSVHGARARKLLVLVCCIGEWVKDCRGCGILAHKRMDAFDRALDELLAHYESKTAAKPRRHTIRDDAQADARP